MGYCFSFSFMNGVFIGVLLLCSSDSCDLSHVEARLFNISFGREVNIFHVNEGAILCTDGLCTFIYHSVISKYHFPVRVPISALDTKFDFLT